MQDSFTDEIIDAIIQNDRRHVGRPRKPLPAWLPKDAWNLAALKPDWGQLPPGAM